MLFNGLFLGISVVLALLGVLAMIIIMCFKDTANIAPVLRQVLSARWVLAVLAGVAFVGFCAAIVICIVSLRMQFKPETLISVLGMLLLVIQGVYKDYFNRQRDNGGNTNPTNIPTNPTNIVDPENGENNDIVNSPDTTKK